MRNLIFVLSACLLYSGAALACPHSAKKTGTEAGLDRDSTVQKVASEKKNVKKKKKAEPRAESSEETRS